MGVAIGNDSQERSICSVSDCNFMLKLNWDEEEKEKNPMIIYTSFLWSWKRQKFHLHSSRETEFISLFALFALSAALFKWNVK